MSKSQTKTKPDPVAALRTVNAERVQKCTVCSTPDLAQAIHALLEEQLKTERFWGYSFMRRWFQRNWDLPKLSNIMIQRHLERHDTDLHNRWRARFYEQR